MANLELDDVIDERVIEACEAAGACSEGVRWARRGRRYRDLDKAGFLQWMALNCPVTGVLELLSKDSSDAVRSWVARNANASAGVLELLSKDSSRAVRYGVARNANASAGVLELLSKDSSDDVRYGVAQNANASAGVLELLSKDSSDAVRYGVARNANASAGVLAKA